MMGAQRGAVAPHAAPPRDTVEVSRLRGQLSRAFDTLLTEKELSLKAKKVSDYHVNRRNSRARRGRGRSGQPYSPYVAPGRNEAQGRVVGDLLDGFVRDVRDALPTNPNTPSPPSSTSSVVGNARMTAGPVAAPVVGAQAAGAVQAAAPTASDVANGPAIASDPAVGIAVDDANVHAPNASFGPSAPVAGSTWAPVGGAAAVEGAGGGVPGPSADSLHFKKTVVTDVVDEDAEGDVDEEMADGSV